jgi:hypothetical protein
MAGGAAGAPLRWLPHERRRREEVIGMSSNVAPGTPPAGRSKARSPLRWIAIGLGVLVLAAALAAGLLPRLSAKEELKKQARELNVPTVAVIQPRPGEAAQELILPGNIEAYVDTPIYARTNGYLKRWLACNSSRRAQWQRALRRMVIMCSARRRQLACEPSACRAGPVRADLRP